MAFVNNAAGMGAGMFGDNSETDSEHDIGPIDEAGQARRFTRERLRWNQPHGVVDRRNDRMEELEQNPNLHWTNTNMDIEDSNDLESYEYSGMEDEEPSE